MDELATPIPVPGNPACQIFQDFPIILTVPLTATGSASVPITLPNDPNLRGLLAYTQWAALNTTTLLFETTPSRRMVLGGLYDVVRIHNTSSNTSPTGSVQQQVGIVTRLHH